MKLTKVVAIILLAAVSVGFTGCAYGGWSKADSTPYKETQFLMDTIIEITAYGPDAEPAVKAAFAEFKRLHDLTNNYDQNSQVSRINQQAGKEKVKVDPAIVQMIKQANQISDKLEGVFDVTVGPIVELWGIGRKGDFVPSQQEIDKVLPLVNYRLIELDEKESTVYLPKQGMLLDLGAVAKETAVRKAGDILKARGISSALINAGGDIRVIGVKPDGAPWRIGVQHPRKQDGMIAKLSLAGFDTMETSGDYQRFIIKDNIRYAHIFDPRTGRQPRELASVTLISNSSVGSDVFSTAIFVLGQERGLAALAKFPGLEAIMVTADGRVVYSPGLEGKVELTGQ